MNKKIIKQLKHGSEEAFNLIYKEYYPLIKQICYFYAKDNFEAEDLAIQVFIKIWNKRDYIDVDKNFKYYLTQIAHNLSKDYLRKKNREKIVLLDSEDIDRISPSKNNEHSDLFKRIERLLDEESYQMLIYRYVHKMKCREIAVMMEVTTSVVTNKISRSLKKLKENLKDEKE